MTYLRWRDGRLPDYVPTLADLRLYALDAACGDDAMDLLSRLLDALNVRRLTIKR